MSDISGAAIARGEPTMHFPDLAGEDLFDVVIVGAGPAGLFAALRAQRANHARLLIVDGGQDVAGRLEARGTDPDNNETITTGFGGAGLFSDGKLCLSHRIGSTVAHRFPAADVEHRQHAIDELIRSGEPAPLQGVDGTAAAALQQRAAALGMEYLHYPIRHVGSDQLPGMLSRLRASIAAGAEVRCQTTALDVVESERPGARWKMLLEKPDRPPQWVHADCVVLAPGKVGAAWMDQLGQRLGLRRHPAQPKLGFRLEGPKDFLDPLLAVAGDPKLIWKAGNGAEVRTHCVCYGGDVVPADYDGLLLVGGHSESSHHADRSNTAVLATAGRALRLTVQEVRRLIAAINDRHAGLVAQRLGDFLTGSPSTTPVIDFARGFDPSMPHVAAGDLATELPEPVVDLLRQFVHRLAELCPQALHPHNVLYGPAVERWAPRFAVSDDMETDQAGLFLVGDGPGLTGGIIGAAETGWLAGNAIAGRLTSAVTHP
ncbi:NAD(P)/FAD-dependent oxidoreductase [Micromonospora sp. NPDC047762]|uniref:NAD(P)/FAD-dependent oxidoreductase n=1 Tax=Micromonospora sp. NPDC047762 TaxID=3364255 RepID=UPI00372418EC